MTRTFIQTDEFSRNWDEFGFNRLRYIQKNRMIICQNRNEITLIYILTDFVTIYNTRSCDCEECI